MSFRANPLSTFGRMSWGAHVLVYPSILAAYIFGVKPYLAQKAVAQEESEWASMPKTKKIDPDLFNPFSPIPYHNNLELKYGFAHIHLHGYLNENQINTKTYVWKGFHNSFDHNDKESHNYNWTSLHSARDHNGAAAHKH